jgi:hypothetical protein
MAQRTLWNTNKPDPENYPKTSDGCMMFIADLGKYDRDKIWQAFWTLDPTGEGPDCGNYRAAFEHGQWWVVGYDSDDERHTWSVVEASGPGSAYGLAFEEC